MSLVLTPGRSVALVGASGAGKSTLAKLAVRFLDPDAGAVHLDGHDVRDLTLASLRRNVALLLQDAPLVDGTVRENVAYGRARRDRHGDPGRARRGGLHAELELDTPVGQRGRSLSGGQRRRVAMARALLQDAPVLILDEPTAGLDPEAAQRLIGPLKELMRDRATLLITHDHALAAAADETVVLADGRVTEVLEPA